MNLTILKKILKFSSSQGSSHQPFVFCLQNESRHSVYIWNLFNLDFDLSLWPFKPKTITSVKVMTLTDVPCTKFQHFRIFRFSAMLWSIVWKCTYWPCDLDLSTQNHIITSISQDHSLYQVLTLRDHLFLSYAIDMPKKQTNKQTKTSYQHG